jgi:preprotein translocase subunit SecG
MYQVIIVIHVLLGLGVIGLVLMQQGKGADAGAAFGTGSAGSVFGAQGAASFLSRSTAILATLFFSTSLGLAVVNGHKGTERDLMATPVTEQNDSGLPTVQGAKTDTPPPVTETAIPAVPPVQSATPTTTEKAEVVETPKTVENKPAEQTKPAVEAVKPVVEESKPVTEEKKPAEIKKPVEHKAAAKDKTKEKKTATTHKGKDAKKEH